MPGAIDNTLIGLILNALTPTGVAGIPGTALGTPLGTLAMRIRLNSTLSTGAAAGTEIATQTSGYTTATNGGWLLTGQSTGAGPAAVVVVPLTTMSFVSNGSPTAVVSFDLQGNSGTRAWWGPFNGQPVNVASGNTFQVTGGSGASAGLQISLTSGADMSFLTGTQQENVYSLNTAVTKNTYTTAAAITAPGTPQARALIPAGFFGSVPNGVGRGLYVHGSGTVATTSAATFIGQLCLNSTPGTLLAAGALTYWPILAPTAATTCVWSLDAWYVCQQVGATSMILQVNGEYRQSVVATGTLSAAPQSVMFQANLTTLNSESQMAVELFGTWSASASGNTTTVNIFDVFGLN